MASLIPREVRARFPKVLTWLPKDALLTPADIAAAKALGATLKASDENTIYIPLENQRPAYYFGIACYNLHPGLVGCRFKIPLISARTIPLSFLLPQ